jgi:hypothetical protein
LSARPWLLTLYLFAISIGAFLLPSATRLESCAGLIAYQVFVLWRIGKLSHRSFATLWRLKYLFLFLILLHTFLPGGEGGDGGERRNQASATAGSGQRLHLAFGIALDWEGLRQSTAMCLQIALVALSAHLVRSAGSTDAFVKGLQSMRVAPLLAYSLDATFGLLDSEPQRGQRRGMGGGGGRGMGGGGGGGRHHGRKRDEIRETQQRSNDDIVDGGGHHAEADRHRHFGTESSESAGAKSQEEAAPASPRWTILSAIRNREFSPFLGRVRQSLQAGRERAAAYGIDPDRAHDVGVITGIAAVMMSFKLLKVLPGIAFFSGHKTIFFIPLYLAAAELTRSRWGATTAGAIMGIIGFTFGDGRYGIFEILKHIAPGFCVDLVWPLVRRLPRSVWLFSALGILAAIARTSTEFVLTFALGARWEAYAFPALKLAPNLIAGALSGIVAYPLIAAVADDTAAKLPDAPAEESPTDAAADARRLTTENVKV